MARDRGCPRVLHRPIRAAGALRNGRCSKNYAVAGRAALRSGDVGNRVVGERLAGVHRPSLGTQWRTSLHRITTLSATQIVMSLKHCHLNATQ